MQIVIDVPEEDYNELIKSGDKTIKLGLYLNLGKAVKNGTPLLKGHGRLIDADKTISKICGRACGCHLEECGLDKHCFSVAWIESASTIIEAESEV